MLDVEKINRAFVVPGGRLSGQGMNVVYVLLYRCVCVYVYLCLPY
jgi:hypothetical protein